MNGRNGGERLAGWLAAALLAAVAAAVLLPGLGGYPLLEEWEPHYGQVAREMAWGEGSPLDPTYKGGRFWSKPPGAFWPVAALYAAVGRADGQGAVELLTRLPSAIAGLAGVLLLAWAAGRVWNRRTGIAAGLLLATSPLYYLTGRQFIVDMPFLACLLGAFSAFLLLAFEADRPWRARAFWICLALATIVKGLLAPLLAGLAIGAYRLLSGDREAVRRLRPGSGLPLFLAVAVPWYVFMTARHGFPYLREFFLRHHFARTTGLLSQPEATFERYVYDLALGLFPWSALLPAALLMQPGWTRSDDPAARRSLFLLSGLLSFGVFFALAGAKYPHYLLPLVPFACLLIATAADRAMSGPASRTAALLCLAAFLLPAIDLMGGRAYQDLLGLITTHRLQAWHPAVADPHNWFLPLFIAFGLLVGAGFAIGRWPRPVAFGLVATALLFSLGVNLRLVPGLCRALSPKPLVEAYLAARQPGEPLADFHTWKSRSLTFYLPFGEHYAPVRDREQLQRLRTLHPDRRVFLTVEQAELPKLADGWRAAGGGELRVVADDGYERFQDVVLVVTTPAAATHPPPDGRHGSRQPPDDIPLRPPVMLGDSIRLAGVRLRPERPSRNGRLEVSLLFHCTAPVGRDWRIFLHVETGGGGRLRGDHDPQLGRHPTTAWQPGEWVTDTFLLDLPLPAGTTGFDLYTGLYESGGRARARGPGAGPDDRIHLGRLELVE